MKLILTATVLLFMTLSANGHAGTDIYKCKSPQGGVVYQQKACNDRQVSGNTSEHRAWRELRALTAEGMDIHSRLGATVASIQQCKTEMRLFNGKLDGMQQRMKRFSIHSPKLYKAYEDLKHCTICKTSAESYCRTANTALNEAMKTLLQQ